MTPSDRDATGLLTRPDDFVTNACLDAGLGLPEASANMVQTHFRVESAKKSAP